MLLAYYSMCQDLLNITLLVAINIFLFRLRLIVAICALGFQNANMEHIVHLHIARQLQFISYRVDRFQHFIGPNPLGLQLLSANTLQCKV